VALLLKRNGIKRIRPLQGGLDAWRERGYPMVNLADSVAEQKGAPI